MRICAVALFLGGVVPLVFGYEQNDVRQLKSLELRFCRATSQAGLKSIVPPPRLVFKDVPSFGDYNPKDNTLTTPRWDQLSPQEKDLFYHLSGPGQTDQQVRAVFENGVHKWVFVHELGHWTQATRMKGIDPGHYAVESDANRVAMAFWRNRDPELISGQIKTFNILLTRIPDPVPAGEDLEKFFNKNYNALGPTQGYIWFQSRMVTSVYAERPVISFPQALRPYEK